MDNIGKLLESYMFSNLAQILAPRNRHAENADPRLDIRRQDPDQERQSKKDDSNEDQHGFDTYDNAVISVESLRVFLQDFLHNLLTGADHSNETTGLAAKPFEKKSVTDQDVEIQTPAIDARAKHAADIYKAGAKTAPRIETALESASEILSVNDTNALPENVLANEDVRLIHTLLKDIAVLQARGIEFLTIERDETFLASLAAAIRKTIANPA